jgi:8-oxo-dGTP pyrophosphatase MutT (NUDIX family)
MGRRLLRGLLNVPAFRPLTPDDLTLVRALHTELGDGADVSAARWHALAATQIHLAAALDVPHGPANATEVFALVRGPRPEQGHLSRAPAGDGIPPARNRNPYRAMIHHARTSGASPSQDEHDEAPLTGPRWWFHLLGLRHGAVHIVLTTPQGWFVAQRRSHTKDDAPGALDVAVTGHCGTSDPLAAAWRELSEELGLAQSDSGVAPSLVDDALCLVAEQEADTTWRAEENPPFIDREHHWIFAATLTAAGMARLRFRDGEVSSVLLVGPDDLRALGGRCRAGQRRVPGELDLAPGLVHTLPLWLAYAAVAAST